MRNALLGSIPALLAGAGLALAQPPAATAPVPAPPTGLIVRAQDGYVLDNAFDPGPPQPVHENAFKADECDQCPPHALFWANLEYLLWTIRQDHVPPLLTTNPATGGTGVLGQAGTQVIEGGGHLMSDLRNGARVPL